MQLALLEEVTERESKRTKFRNTFLTERDCEVIEFIIEMKFASVVEVYDRFFKVTLSDENSKSNLWARKRLMQLKQGGFLRANRTPNERETYYSATYKAYYALSNIYPDKSICKPVGGFDHRTFKHDQLVLKCRLDLERQQNITNWISDRRLKASAELSGGLTALQVPDAIYSTADGEKVAFEMEISRKEKSRYSSKVTKYVSLVRQAENKRKFGKVLFVCTQDAVKDLLVKETKIYGSIFEVRSMNEFILSLAGGKNV